MVVCNITKSELMSSLTAYGVEVSKGTSDLFKKYTEIRCADGYTDLSAHSHYNEVVQTADFNNDNQEGSLVDIDMSNDFSDLSPILDNNEVGQNTEEATEGTEEVHEEVEATGDVAEDAFSNVEDEGYEDLDFLNYTAVECEEESSTVEAEVNNEDSEVETNNEGVNTTEANISEVEEEPKTEGTAISVSDEYELNNLEQDENMEEQVEIDATATISNENMNETSSDEADEFESAQYDHEDIYFMDCVAEEFCEIDNNRSSCLDESTPTGNFSIEQSSSDAEEALDVSNNTVGISAIATESTSIISEESEEDGDFNYNTDGYDEDTEDGWDADDDIDNWGEGEAGDEDLEDEDSEDEDDWDEDEDSEEDEGFDEEDEGFDEDLEEDEGFGDIDNWDDEDSEDDIISNAVVDWLESGSNSMFERQADSSPVIPINPRVSHPQETVRKPSPPKKPTSTGMSKPKPASVEVVKPRDADANEIRTFVREHPKCSHTDLVKYFTSKSIQKALLMGKIIKKGNIYK